MNQDRLNYEGVEFFDERARNGVFDSYSEKDRLRLIALFDDIQLPRNEALKVLDCGCGTGRAMELMAKRLGAGAEVVGVDSSPAMIEKARALRTPPEGVKYEFRVGDCMELPFDDGAFDWVIAIDAFPYFRDLTKALREMARVLKEGGYVAILSQHSSDETNQHHREIGGAVANDLMPDATKFLQLMRDADLWLQIYVDDADGFRSLARK
jgi:ubiquinone/menaquinone biosynthesis C-methylase UbiE